MSNQPLVSVSVLTFNQKNYIKQCLDSILAQKTNFKFEILIGEDESTDGTRELCVQYANKYPNKINLFLRSRDEVIYVNGNATGRFNFIENLKSAKGKYIALCEGDDYWTDPLKLQKQVDFMEANKNYSLCFHRVNVSKNNVFEPHIIPKINCGDVIYNDLLQIYNFIATCSVMYKNFDISNNISEFKKSPWGDLFLYKLISNQGKLGCLNDTMAVYRIHDNGIYSGINNKDRLIVTLGFYRNIYYLLNQKEKRTIRSKSKTVIKKLIQINSKRHRLINNVYFFLYYYFYLLQCKFTNCLRYEN